MLQVADMEIRKKEGIVHQEGLPFRKTLWDAKTVRGVPM